MTGIFMMAIQIAFVMTGFYGANKGLEYFYDKKGGKKNGNVNSKATNHYRGE